MTPGGFQKLDQSGIRSIGYHPTESESAMSRLIDYAQYTKHTVKDGAPAPDEVVSGSYVQRFVASETLAWFRSLGGTEQVTKRGDLIYVTSTSPAGDEVRKTTFTPVVS